MKNFRIDSQTFKDLNIFSEQSDSNSIFDLFKGTRTLGARDRLREMMLKPSADVEELKLRRDSIAYFCDRQIDFAIQKEELDLIDFYLKLNQRKSRRNLIDSMSVYLTRNSSNDYYIIKTGLKYLLKLSRYLLEFITAHLNDDAPIYLKQLLKEIKNTVESGLLKQGLLWNENKLKFYQVSQLDHAFRGAEKENIFALLQLVYELDVFENVSQVASKLKLSFPVYDERDELNVSIAGVFHLGLENPVANDIDVNNAQNIIFLTGSNMAGKSSLLKSIGLCIYLSHLGFPVPATSMSSTIFNGLITTINLSDNLNEGLSHYYSEVKRVKEVSLALVENDKMFIVFDELFRGTNVKDAFDASLLIISALSTVKNSAFFISTHIVELAEELKKQENISFRYLETFFKDEKPVFTYKLANGISKERLGMYIVLNEGIVEILSRAK